MYRALLSGLFGSVVLTILHETARQLIKTAPRVDVTGERGLSAALEFAAGERVPEKDLYLPAMAGDLTFNALYFSLAGIGERRGALMRGAILGAAAGVGAVFLPDKMGLGSSPTRRTAQTAWMTAAWYTAGGIAAGAAFRLLSRR